MRRAVVDLASTRPVWRAPAATVEAIRRALGRGWEVAHVTAPTSSDGDGARPAPEAVRAVGEAELYFGWGVAREIARAAKGSLRWAHTATAGARGSLSPEFRATGALLTNSRETHAAPMADWAVAAIALSLRGFHAAVAAQREGRWAKDVFTDGRHRLAELADGRVGIVGLGGVGRAVARRCRALGMQVSGVRRHAGRRRPAGVHWVGGPGDLVRLARRNDVLVITAPHTPETDGLVGEPVLAALPDGAFVINLARGALLDEAALLVHLESGHLGGAVLDVFATEPLPPGHPLWTHPRVVVSPHVSAVSARFWERETALIVENIRRYRVGRRLKNLVDPRIGY